MKPPVKRALLWGGICTGAFAGVWALMASGLSHDLDDALILSATSFTREHPGWYRLLVVVDEALQPRWTYLVASAICLVVGWRQRRQRAAIIVVAGMLACWGLTNVVKLIAHRDRPVVTDAVFHAPGFSFPSGHASGSAAVATALVFFFWPQLKERGRAIAVAAGGGLMLVTCLDRVFLGVHFPTDVIAGTIFGMALVSTLWLAAADRIDQEGRP